MRLLPDAGPSRFAAIAGWLVAAALALILFFEFVVNRYLLPSNF